MHKKSTRTTNQDQFRAMVNLMKKYPDIAKNNSHRTPEIVRDFWNNLQKELNAIGPPRKEISQWKKVWCDYKSFLRKKLLAEKKENTATGGGPSKKIVFTSLEKEVVELVCLKDCVQGVCNKKSFGVPTCFLISSENITIPEANIAEDHTILIGENDNTTSIPNLENEVSTNLDSEVSTILEATPRAKRKCQCLLEKQVDCQQKFYDVVNSGLSHQSNNWKENNSKRMCKIMEKLYDQNTIKNKILQDQLNENIRHNKCMEELALEKNKIKAQLIEIEFEKLKNSRNNSN